MQALWHFKFKLLFLRAFFKKTCEKMENIGYDIGQTFDGRKKKTFNWSYIMRLFLKK
jgi:hypothetical protein